MDRLASQRILVVEDEQGQAQVISFLFKQQFGAEVETAASCREAREKLEESAFDLVTLDYQLPDGDGLQLLQELRERPDAPPAILITGHGDEKTAVAAFKLGASGYVVKDKRMSTMIIEEARSALARARLTSAEAAPAETERRLQEIFDASSSAIMTYNDHGRLELINKSAMDILGIASPEDTKEFSLFDRPYLSHEFKERLSQGKPARMLVEYDFESIRKHGLYKPLRSGSIFLEGTVTPLASADTRALRGYLVQFEDVTERVRNEKAIKAQRDLALGVLATDSLAEALGQVLSAVLEATGLDAGGIYVYDESHGLLTLTCHQGISAEFVQSVREYQRTDPRAAIVLNGQAVYTTYDEVPPDEASFNTEGLKAFALVPLLAGKEVLGCMNLASRYLEGIPAELRDFIESLAGEAAQAIQREMTAAALRDERDRIKHIMDALPVGMVLLDRDAKMLMQNRAAREMSELSSKEEETRTDSSPEWETTDWDGNPMPVSETPFVKAMTEGKPAMGIRLSALTGLGKRIYVTESAAPILNENGEIESILLSLEDMTDLRNALAAVRMGERLYRETVESLNEGLWVLDADAVTTFVSDRMAEMLGYEPEEMIGVSVLDFADDESKEKMKRRLAARRTGVAEQYDFDFLRKDGTRLQAYLAAAPIMDENGDFIGSHAGVLDITDRKRAEEELKESELRFRTLADFTYDWETWRAPDGTYAYVSPSCERISGYSPEEFMADPDLFVRLVHSDDRDTVVSHFKKELKSRQPLHLEFRIIARNGSERWIGHTCQPVHLEDGTPLGPRASNRDITERKKAAAELAKHRENLEELIKERTAELEKLNDRLRVEISEREMAEKELLRLNEELDAYARTVSHELRTPLAGIWLALEYLERISGELSTERFEEEAKDTVLKAKSTVKKADEQVKRLLELAEAGQVPVDIVDVDVSEVVDGVLFDIEDEVARLGATVEVSGDLGLIRANPTHIHQLFSNLIVNAVKHCDSPEPRIEIALIGEESHKGHRYLIRDNGSGIPPELIDRLFSPFVKREGGGSGTGLAIVDKIVKIYNGSIRAYNDNGACFEFVLYDYQRVGTTS